MASKRLLVLQAMLERVQAVKKSAGFNTDAGRTVFFGFAPTLGPDDPNEAIAMLVGEEEPVHQMQNVVYDLPIEFQAIAKDNVDQPWVRVEYLVEDITNAVELEDRRLGGLLGVDLLRRPRRTIEREEGSLVVGTECAYVARVKETWGEP